MYSGTESKDVKLESENSQSGYNACEEKTDLNTAETAGTKQNVNMEKDAVNQENASPVLMKNGHVMDKSESTRDNTDDKYDGCGTCRGILRQDVIAWLSAMLFIALLIGAIFIAGSMRDWDAPSGYSHNTSVSSSYRFLPEPFTPEPGVFARSDKNAPARWYYWKIPTDDVTVWTRLFPWSCYVLHQLLIWTAIYWAQTDKAYSKGAMYSHRMSSWNWFALAANAVFHILHFVNTHTTYDALAQDVSVSTSQGSVTMLICMVILMEYKDRGLFFGWPAAEHDGKISKKFRLNIRPMELVRRYHGYAFAWAAIYTFWYHPMENTIGHAVGFFYTWIILLQGSLMYTRIHQNRWWRLLQEAFVVLHGTVVAVQTRGPELDGTRMWPQFSMGAAVTLVITQVFVLWFWRRIPAWTRIIPLALWLAVTLWVFSWLKDYEGRTWTRLNELLYIPSLYYIFFIVCWGILIGFIALENRISPNSNPPSTKRKLFFITAAMLIYVFNVGFAFGLAYIDIKVHMVILLFVVVAIYNVGALVSFMLLKQAIPSRAQVLSWKLKMKNDCAAQENHHTH